MITKRDTLFLKGLSILLLVYHHNNALLNPVQRNLRIVVWVFLFITAYGFASQIEKIKPKDYLKFTVKRLALLYVPLWICYIVLLLISLIINPEAVFAYYSGPPHIWIIDLFNLSFYFGTPTFFGSWYINMLVLLIVLFPGLYFIVSKLKWFSLIPFLLIVWFFKWKIYYKYGGYLDEYLLIVIIGILFYQYKVFSHCPKVKGIWRIPLIVISVMAFVMALCLRNEYLQIMYDLILLRFDPFSNALALSLITLVYILRSDDKVSLVFEKLGTYSGDIFYIHSIFYNSVFPKIGITNAYVALFLCFAASLLISILVEKGKECIGLNKKLRKGLDNILKIPA